MAEIVAAYAVPHTPSFIAEVAKNGVASPTAGFFATIKAHLDEINPDVLILIQNDHFNTFFLDNWLLASLKKRAAQAITLRRCLDMR
jgi:hypothetical protein